jgi:hypothetical protein
MFQVFSLPQLPNLIAEAEESLSTRQSSHFSSSGGFSVLGTPTSSHGGVTSSPLEVQPRFRWQAAVTQAITELEGAEFPYKTFFGQDTLSMVC